MTDRTVGVDGITVAFTDRGTGQPVLCLHGNPDSRHSWAPLFAELGDGYRLIAPDFPGFGDSEPLPPGVDPGPETMSRFWGEFLDAAGIDSPVHVVVHDFGGPWLLPWAVAHTDRVRSLFILNTIFHRDYAWHRWARIWQTPVVGELVMALTNRSVLRREMRRFAPGVPPELVDEAYGRMHRTMRATVLRWYRAHARPDEVFDPWEDALLAATRRIPSRVVWGDRDPYIPSLYAERFGAEAVHLPDLGHWLHLEAPGVVAGHLAALLAAPEVRQRGA